MTGRSQAHEARHSVVLDKVRSERGYAGKIARLCGISREAVWKWKAVPLHHIGKIRDYTGLRPHQINPDLFNEDGLLRAMLRNGKK